LAVALVELWLEPGHVAELGRAHRREVLRVREEDGPAIADPLVEVDGALGGLCREVRRLAVDSECHGILPCRVSVSLGILRESQPPRLKRSVASFQVAKAAHAAITVITRKIAPAQPSHAGKNTAIPSFCNRPVLVSTSRVA